MKKIIAFILALAMCLSLCACSGGNKKAFEASKVAYDNIDIAYEITEQLGTDIYEAWRLGIYEDDEVLKDGVSHLASELNLSKDELTEGVIYALVEWGGQKSWDEVPEEDKETLRPMVDSAFLLFSDDLFSFCVETVVCAYKANGKIDEAQTALDIAKTQMKELSDKYSDYEHYPNLKDYYTTTSSFFDFCQDPSGSFEQVKDTINDYKNDARDYISDLDYIFEE